MGLKTFLKIIPFLQGANILHLKYKNKNHELYYMKSLLQNKIGKCNL